MPNRPNGASRTLARRARTALPGNRASAGLELALGTAGLLAVAAVCLDLYTRVEADTTVARIAVTGPTLERTIGSVVVPKKETATKPGSDRVSDRLVSGLSSLEGGCPMTMNSVT